MNSVLIIDDDKELCTLMKKCVEKENLSAIIAHGGMEGIRLVDENKSSGSLSLVILDVMMPDINGFQVLKMSFISKLRKKIEPDPDRPFYILTVRGVGYRFNKEA